MGFKCGIIGLPNVGKSTLFNILTNSKIPAKNFPFCTIKPNVGLAPVFDLRLNKIANIVHPKRIITTFMEFVDIAGLVKGASQGCGLGNQFLSNIHQVDLLIHVVRCFNDNNIVHMHEHVNPIYDVDIINMELILSDLNICQVEILKLKKKNIFDKYRIKILEQCLHCLNSNHFLNTLFLGKQDLNIIDDLHFITLKPMIYIANISNDSVKNVDLSKFLNFISLNKSVYIPVQIFTESQNTYLKLSNLNHVHFEENKESKINKIIQTGYKLLGLQTFFTVGKKEVRSWTINLGSTSVQAARKIHTDFEKGFIRAEVISYIDFIKFKYHNKIREFGKIRLEGKHYVVQDGDIIKFLFKV
ncbi:Ribosome-binding ATPase YchF [Buchnera aphidicola (Takecallis arundicolens)]|uniref:redox-regulated ATPase YchF n=1 Tax=Buchnera aphidicola TaxID=9 RepID=UPI003463898F